MEPFDPQSTATHFEVLAKSALNEKPGEKTAEGFLMAAVIDLQKDPEHLESVRKALVADSSVPNGLPKVALNTESAGVSISIAAGWMDYIKDSYQFEKIDVDSKIAAKSTTMNGTRLYSSNFSRIELISLNSDK
jgi:hypothetical protein